MGRQARGKREQERAEAQLAQAVAQARQTWLGKRVRFDLQQGYGVQYGRVIQISDDGDVIVVCLPGYDRPIAALAFTLGFLPILILAEE